MRRMRRRLALPAINRLISQDKVDLVLGTFSSLLNIPASAVAEKAGKTYIGPSCGSPDMFNRKFRHIFFAQPATAAHQADLFAQYVAGLPADQRPRTAAYPAQDDPFAQPVIDGVRRQLETIGIKTVYSKVYPAETSNFDSIAGDIRAAKPDLIVQGAVFEDGVGLVRSLKKANFVPKVMFQTSAPSNRDQYIKGVGGASSADGEFYAVSWSPETNFPLNQEFVSSIRPGSAACRRRTPPTRSPPARYCRPRWRRSAHWTRTGSRTGCTTTRSRRSSARSRGTRLARRRGPSSSPSGRATGPGSCCRERLPTPTR